MIKSVRWREFSNFLAIDFTGAAPHVGGIYSSRFSFVFSFFLLLLLVSSIHPQATIRKGFWRMTAQKTWFGVRMYLLGIRSVKINSYVFKIPKNCFSIAYTSFSQNDNVRKCWKLCRPNHGHIIKIIKLFDGSRYSHWMALWTVPDLLSIL